MLNVYLGLKNKSLVSQLGSFGNIFNGSNENSDTSDDSELMVFLN